MMPEMFADDIHIFLDGQDNQSLMKVMQITKEFSALSGLQLSASKTEVLGINEAQIMRTEATNMQLKIVDKIKFVGAYVTKKQGKQENLINFDKAFSQINSVYKAWQWRRLSPLGVTVIIKSLMTSTLTHLLVNFQLEQQPVADYVKLMKSFIWSGRPQVQNRRLEQLIGKGGINLILIPDFIASLRMRWYRLICKAEINKHNWLIILQSWLKEENLDIVDIPKLGYHDLSILATKMKNKGLIFV
jgi:hypothetical protein